MHSSCTLFIAAFFSIDTALGQFISALAKTNSLIPWLNQIRVYLSHKTTRQPLVLVQQFNIVGVGGF